MPRCAVLDAAGVFIGMEEVDTPTARHLPQITACDLPAGEYAWQPDGANPYGGEFVALPMRLRLAAREAIAAAKGGRP